MNGGSEITIDMSTCLNKSLLGSIRIDLHNHAVFEIKDFFHAHAGCPDKKISCTLLSFHMHIPIYMYIGIDNVEKPCTLWVHIC